MTDRPKLNATAYSLLGLIDKKSWSAYELTEFMSKSVIRFIMPRSPSQLYSEPKKLAALGFIEIEKTAKGKQQRTQYHITTSGRNAFQAWLKEAGAPPKIEYKSLLKFYLVDPTDTASLKKKAQEMRHETLEQMQSTLTLLNEIIEQGGIYRDTVMVASMSSRFGIEEFKARLNWLDQLDQWLEQPLAKEDMEAWSMKCYQQSQQQLKRLLKKYL